MKKITTFKRLMGVAALATMPLFVQAQELKIGYVNSERVLRESAAARAASVVRAIAADGRASATGAWRFPRAHPDTPPHRARPRAAASGRRSTT